MALDSNSDTVLDDESRLSSSNPSPSPVIPASNSNANTGSSSPNPTPSDSATNGENRLSSHSTTPTPSHNPTPSNPAPSNYQNYSQPPPSQYYELFQPSNLRPPPRYYYDPAYAPLPDDGRIKCCLCRLILIIIAVIIDLAIISYFVDLAYKPKHPNFSLSSARVSSLTTSTSFSTMSYDFKLTFSIENPNKRMNIDYAGVVTTITHGSRTIARNQQHKFFQNANGTISKEVRVVEVDRDVSLRAIKAIKDDVAKNHGEVKFGVNMQAYLTFSRIHWIPRYYGAYCPDVKFKFVNATARGEMVGPAIACNSVQDWRWT